MIAAKETAPGSTPGAAPGPRALRGGSCRGLGVHLALALLLATTVAGQPFSLTTTFQGGSGHKGCMFDVAAGPGGPVTIQHCAQNFLGAGGPAAIEIWTVAAGGPFAPHQSNPAAWTLLASGTITTNPLGRPTVLPWILGVTLQPNEVRGFYVTCTGATPANVAYTVGLPLTQGLAYANDGRLEIRTGVGKSYPFGFTFTTRIWNGTVVYCAGASCPADYETNDAAADLAIDGVVGTPFQAAVVAHCPGTPFTLSASSTQTGLPFEAAITCSPLRPAQAGGAVSPSGTQTFNIDFGSPSLWFLMGGAVPQAQPFAGNFTIPGSAPGAGTTLTIQQLNGCPPHPDGYALSQGCQLDVPSVPALVGPSGDDSVLVVTPADAPFCAPGPILFYGTAHTRLNVLSNGRVGFGVPDLDFSPTVLEARQGAPFVGAWCDLSPNLGGAIRTSLPSANLLRVAWRGVPYFGNPSLTAGFTIEFDLSTGAVALEGLSSLPLFPPTASTSNGMFLGLSPGGPNAVDPGPTPFAISPSTAGPVGAAMLYAYGIAGTLVPGVDRLDFIPNTTGGYDWSGQ